MIYTYSQLGHYGALGNQLFQIAGVLGKAASTGAKPRFPSDWFYRPYFNIPDKYFTEIPDGEEVRDEYPDYLQDWRLFEDIQGDIVDFFSPSEWAASQLPEVAPGTCAVHVRRANNLALPNHHPVPPIEHFAIAISRLGIGSPSQLYVFSDDIKWCKKQDLFSGARFADGVPENVDLMTLTAADPAPLHEAAIDLLTMAKCDKFIISNSTFSWWSAWLADPQKLTPVAYPEHWYGPALKNIDTTYFIPSHWTKIHVDISY